MELLANDLLKLLVPAFGALILILLGLIAFMARRLLTKFDSFCVELNTVLHTVAESQCRISVLEERCQIFHNIPSSNKTK